MLSAYLLVLLLRLSSPSHPQRYSLVFHPIPVPTIHSQTTVVVLYEVDGSPEEEKKYTQGGPKVTPHPIR